MTRGAMAGIALMASLAGPGNAAAEPIGRPIAAAVERLAWSAPDAARPLATPGAPQTQLVSLQPDPAIPATERSKGARIGRRIAGAAVGAVGGAFAGGYLGAAIDGDCGGCDDPGFKGFLIGFPVGGVVGGVLGGLYLFR
jgi:hypothetical protein